MDDSDDYDEVWYPEEPGQQRYGFCGDYALHETHWYGALNGWTMECPGWDEADEAWAIEQQNAAPCEHGLSQSLCAGPDHYPLDYDRERF